MCALPTFQTAHGVTEYKIQSSHSFVQCITFLVLIPQSHCLWKRMLHKHNYTHTCIHIRSQNMSKDTHTHTNHSRHGYKLQSTYIYHIYCICIIRPVALSRIKTWYFFQINNKKRKKTKVSCKKKSQQPQGYIPEVIISVQVHYIHYTIFCYTYLHVKLTWVKYFYFIFTLLLWTFLKTKAQFALSIIHQQLFFSSIKKTSLQIFAEVNFSKLVHFTHETIMNTLKFATVHINIKTTTYNWKNIQNAFHVHNRNTI